MSASGFRELYGTEPDFDIFAPGRTELGGNHTDHQHGKVLASPVNLYVRAWVKRTNDGIIHFYSEGYAPFEVDLSDTSVRPEEAGTTAALVRGVANAFTEYGLPGFQAYVTSEIPAGSGLSSSAAVEILLGRICSRLTGVERSGEELAILGQYVENQYFGKPCGLMDQMACAADGIIAIDFQDPAKPVTEEITYNFRSAGYELCIVKCGAGHEDLTDQYAGITKDLADVCAVFGKKVLRDIPEEEFFARIPELRKAAGDRAVLRAIHVYDDNRRVAGQIEALKANDIKRYLELVNESGDSSWKLLQNVIPEGATKHQEMAFALELVRRLLKGNGAVRVHGGGFAGTLQASVPCGMADAFRREIEAVLGEGSCIFIKS